MEEKAWLEVKNAHKRETDQWKEGIARCKAAKAPKAEWPTKPEKCPLKKTVIAGVQLAAVLDDVLGDDEEEIDLGPEWEDSKEDDREAI